MKLKNILKIVFIIAVVLIATLFIYSRIIQAQINTSGLLFDERCNNVNPALIAYKKTYIHMWDMLKDPVKHPDQELKDLMSQYLDGIKKYIPLEDNWLKKETEFVESFSYNLFQPEYFKKLGLLQINMYKAQRDDAQVILDIWDGKKDDNNAAQKLHEASNAYFAAYEKAKIMKDWRKYFWHEPAVNCPEENLDIPDTSVEAIFPSPSAKPSQEQINS